MQRKVKADLLLDNMPLEVMEIVHLSESPLLHGEKPKFAEVKTVSSAIVTDGKLISESTATKKIIDEFYFDDNAYFNKTYGYTFYVSQFLKTKYLKFANHSYVIRVLYEKERIPNRPWYEKPLNIKIYLKDVNDKESYKKAKKIARNLKNEFTERHTWKKIEFEHVDNLSEIRMEENPITHEMQELEGLLIKLKSLSIEEYNVLNSEYTNLLKHDNHILTLSTISLANVVSLKNKVEFAILNYSDNITSVLDKRISLYIYNLRLNNKFKMMSIKEIDDLFKYYLNNKDYYSSVLLNDILKKLCFLYVLVIYQNRNNISYNELNNSYAADNVIRMICTIDSLYEEGIITNVPSKICEIKDLDEFLELINIIQIVPIKNEVKQI